LEADHADGGCKDSAAWCKRGEVSLYCFEQIVAWGPEEELAKMQLKNGASIFACNDFTVTCAQKRLLGTDKEGNEVHTVVNPENGKVPLGDVSKGATTTSFLNVLIFMKAWDILIDEGKVWAHDWTVKVDPDAVFFPARLRPQLKGHTGSSFPPSYVLNCKEKHWKQTDKQGHGHFTFVPKLYGAVEIYNKKALGLYQDVHKRCLKELQWRQWGEDMYMRECMNLLGAAKVVDYELVGDDRCPENPHSSCWDANRPAYHPYKDVNSWFRCWNQSMGVRSTAADTAGSASHSDGVARPFGGCGGISHKQRACPDRYRCHRASKWYWQCLPEKDVETDV